MIKEHDLGWLVVIEWSIRSNLQSQMMSDERPQVLDVENLTRAAGADTHTHTHTTRIEQLIDETKTKILDLFENPATKQSQAAHYTENFEDAKCLGLDSSFHQTKVPNFIILFYFLLLHMV